MLRHFAFFGRPFSASYWWWYGTAHWRGRQHL